MAHNWKWYVKNNDFEGCLERFNAANKGWKKHWFSVLEDIYNNCKEWSKKYILDPVEMVVITISDCIKKTTKKVQNLVNGANSHTYLINMYDEEDNLVFTKIGKADNINKRFRTLERQYYATQGIQIARVEPVHIFDVKNDDLAQVLESFIRNLFRKTRDFIPNDRFKPFTPSEEEWKEMERYYKLVCAE